MIHYLNDSIGQQERKYALDPKMIMYVDYYLTLFNFLHYYYAYDILIKTNIVI